MWMQFAIRKKIEAPEFVLGGYLTDDSYPEYSTPTYYKIYLLPYKGCAIPCTWDKRRQELVLGIREEFYKMHPEIFSEKMDIDYEELDADKEFWKCFCYLEFELRREV